MKKAIISMLGCTYLLGSTVAAGINDNEIWLYHFPTEKLVTSKNVTINNRTKQPFVLNGKNHIETTLSSNKPETIIDLNGSWINKGDSTFIANWVFFTFYDPEQKEQSPIKEYVLYIHNQGNLYIKTHLLSLILNEEPGYPLLKNDGNAFLDLTYPGDPGAGISMGDIENRGTLTLMNETQGHQRAFYNMGKWVGGDTPKTAGKLVVTSNMSLIQMQSFPSQLSKDRGHTPNIYGFTEVIPKSPISLNNPIQLGDGLYSAEMPVVELKSLVDHSAEGPTFIAPLINTLYDSRLFTDPKHQQRFFGIIKDTENQTLILLPTLSSVPQESSVDPAIVYRWARTPLTKEADARSTKFVPLSTVLAQSHKQSFRHLLKPLDTRPLDGVWGRVQFAKYDTSDNHTLSLRTWQLGADVWTKSTPDKQSKWGVFGSHLTGTGDVTSGGTNLYFDGNSFTYRLREGLTSHLRSSLTSIGGYYQQAAKSYDAQYSLQYVTGHTQVENETGSDTVHVKGILANAHGEKRVNETGIRAIADVTYGRVQQGDMHVGAENYGNHSQSMLIGTIGVGYKKETANGVTPSARLALSHDFLTKSNEVANTSYEKTWLSLQLGGTYQAKNLSVEGTVGYKHSLGSNKIKGKHADLQVKYHF